MYLKVVCQAILAAWHCRSIWLHIYMGRRSRSWTFRCRRVSVCHSSCVHSALWTHPFRHKLSTCRYIKIVKKHRLEISQPGVDPSTGLTWQMTKRRRDHEVHRWALLSVRPDTFAFLPNERYTNGWMGFQQSDGGEIRQVPWPLSSAMLRVGTILLFLTHSALEFCAYQDWVFLVMPWIDS